MARLLLASLALAACSATSPDDGLDALTEAFVRVRAEVPSFGGVALEGDRAVVITLGENPAAAPAARSIFSDGVEVRARPERGRAGEWMLTPVSAAVLGTVEDAQSVDYDETTGYVVVDLATAAGLEGAYSVVAEAGLPASEVLFVVTGSRVRAL